MLLINPEGEYPRYIGDLLLENPSWQEGDELPDGWIEVQESSLPSIGQDEAIEELAPEILDGVYVQKFAVRPLTQAELDAREAKLQAIQNAIANGESPLSILLED